MATYVYRCSEHGPAGMSVTLDDRQLFLDSQMAYQRACLRAVSYLPTGIFDFPVEPSASGPVRIDPGQGAPRSSF